jgi:hypothetical protein
MICVVSDASALISADDPIAVNFPALTANASALGRVESTVRTSALSTIMSGAWSRSPAQPLKNKASHAAVKIFK